ncbi:rhodanese-like domain-containing protein [Thermodesulforhabdus norvegica]|uniref:Thiosulfate sulfurtransferase n=1 Tax=Thermodesulforhabdus norvegica TaxID=39841 RepID=A0A1I4TNF7_9BACT|nr:rhodanese-like domain-containing protein [Thermodesulforhabdus norvegica]SFM78322.1 thiosulfate sulfurtransferase [Thermodesulforhabdus norvegica]
MREKHLSKISILMVCFLSALSAYTYAFDTELAKKFYGMFSQMTPEVVAQKPCQITPARVLEMIKAREPFLFLDIRTPQETGIVGLTYPDTLRIPMNELFREDNLGRLPKDRKIVVVCHSGTRAAPVAMALKMLGFDAYLLKGGLPALAREAGTNVVELFK